MAIVLATMLALGCFCWLRTNGFKFSFLKDDSVHVITNYFDYSRHAMSAYNKVVDYFAKNSDKLKLLNAKYNYCSSGPCYRVIIKYKSLDNKTTFAGSDII